MHKPTVSRILLLPFAAALSLSSCSLIADLTAPFEDFFSTYTEWTSEDGRFRVMVQGGGALTGYSWAEINGKETLCYTYFLSNSSPITGDVVVGYDTIFSIRNRKVRSDNNALDITFSENKTGDPYYDSQTVRMARRVLDESEYDFRYFYHQRLFNNEVGINFTCGEWDDFNRYATYQGRDLVMSFGDGKTFEISEGSTILSSGTYVIDTEDDMLAFFFAEDSLFGLEGSSLDMWIIDNSMVREV